MSFYDNKFWESGSGLMIWHHRLLTTVLNEIRYEGMPEPFITHIYYDNDRPSLETYEGMIASWENPEEKDTLAIELTHRTMDIYSLAYDYSEDNFWYSVGDEEDLENYVPFSQLPEKLAEVKQWLKEHPRSKKEGKTSLESLTDFMK